MLARKLDAKTLAMVRARADFFFSEQLKRLGPLPAPVPTPIIKRPRTRKTNTHNTKE